MLGGSHRVAHETLVHHGVLARLCLVFGAETRDPLLSGAPAGSEDDPGSLAHSQSHTIVMAGTHASMRFLTQPPLYYSSLQELANLWR